MNRTQFIYKSFGGVRVTENEYEEAFDLAEGITEQLQTLVGRNVLVDVLELERHRGKLWVVSIWRLEGDFSEHADAVSRSDGAERELYFFENAANVRVAVVWFIQLVMASLDD